MLLWAAARFRWKFLSLGLPSASVLPDGERLVVGGPRPGRVARVGEHVAGHRVRRSQHAPSLLSQVCVRPDFLRQLPRLLERF